HWRRHRPEWRAINSEQTAYAAAVGNAYTGPADARWRYCQPQRGDPAPRGRGDERDQQLQHAQRHAEKSTDRLPQLVINHPPCNGVIPTTRLVGPVGGGGFKDSPPPQPNLFRGEIC